MPETVGDADAEYVRKDVFDAHMQRMEEKITALLEKNFIATKAEIKSLNDHMEQGFAMVNARIDVVDARIDATNERMDQKFASVNERMEQGFAMVNARIDAVDARIDATNERMDQGFATVNARIDATNTRIDDLHSFMGWGFAVATICITLFSMTLPILTQYLSKRLEKRASSSSRKKASPGRSPRLAGAVSVR